MADSEVSLRSLGPAGAVVADVLEAASTTMNRLREERDAARHNLAQARQDLSAETAANVQLEAERNAARAELATTASLLASTRTQLEQRTLDLELARAVLPAAPLSDEAPLVICPDCNIPIPVLEYTRHFRDHRSPSPASAPEAPACRSCGFSENVWVECEEHEGPHRLALSCSGAVLTAPPAPSLGSASAPAPQTEGRPCDYCLAPVPPGAARCPKCLAPVRASTAPGAPDLRGLGDVPLDFTCSICKRPLHGDAGCEPGYPGDPRPSPSRSEGARCQRTEPFDASNRCELAAGHPGWHRAGQAGWGPDGFDAPAPPTENQETSR